MVTITTKTVNYSITRNDRTNSVNATVTSTPGFNVNALKSPNGLLKLLELLLATIALILLLYHVERPRNFAEKVLKGEIFVISVIVTGIVIVVGLLIAYILSITNWILTTRDNQLGILMQKTHRTTNIETVLNAVLSVLYLTAGILLLVIVITHQELVDEQAHIVYRLTSGEFWSRIIAGILLLILSLLHALSALVGHRDLRGTAKHGPAVATTHPNQTVGVVTNKPIGVVTMPAHNV